MTIYVIYTFREPQLLSRIVSSLYPAEVIVHVDSKVDEDPFVNAITAADKDRVSFVRNRVRVNWGGWSQVVAIRRMIALALMRARPDEYIVLLSGQDYPLTSVVELERHFANNPGKQFLRYFEIDSSTEKYKAQINQRHYRDLPFFTKKPLQGWRRKLRTLVVLIANRLGRLKGPVSRPANLTLAFGPTHFAMQAWFLSTLEESVTPEIEAYFARTFCPEEKFYQSLSASLPIEVNTGGPARNGAEHFQGEGNWRYANLHLIDPSLTRVFTMKDWEEVVASKQFFIRKVEQSASRDLLQAIDKRREESQLQ